MQITLDMLLLTQVKYGPLRKPRKSTCRELIMHRMGWPLLLVRFLELVYLRKRILWDGPEKSLK